jgi:hypothetical protein
MKRNILFVAAAAAAAIAYSIVSKKKQSRLNGHSYRMKSHHMTDLFARAKEQAVK